MDLALELRQPVDTLMREMTEREFWAWVRYAERKMLPQRRIELYLAQIAYLIACTMGGAENVTLADYLFDPKTPEQQDAEISDEDVEELKMAIGFRPQRKG